MGATDVGPSAKWWSRVCKIVRPVSPNCLSVSLLKASRDAPSAQSGFQTTPESLLSEEAAVGMKTMLAPDPPASCSKRSTAFLPPLAITRAPASGPQCSDRKWNERPDRTRPAEAHAWG